MSSMAAPVPSDRRTPRTLLTVVRAAILAGLLAGGVLAVFHAFLTVPVVDQAFAFEAQDTGIDTDPLPLAPGQQQKLALVSGSVVYGVVVGLLLGGVFYLAQEALPGRRAFTSAAFLAVMAYWVVGLFPSVKYPANPPGIGLTTLSDYRQALYLGFTLLSIAAALVTTNAFRYLEHRRLVIVGYVVFAVAAFLFMPPNPDPFDTPVAIVTSYRILSFVSLTLFWAVLGAAFAILVEYLQPDAPSPGLEPRIA